MDLLPTAGGDLSVDSGSPERTSNTDSQTRLAHVLLANNGEIANLCLLENSKMHSK